MKKFYYLSILLLFYAIFITSCNSDDSTNNQLEKGIPGFYKLEKLSKNGVEIDLPNKFLEIKTDGTFYFFEYRDPGCDLNIDKYFIEENQIIIEKEFIDFEGGGTTTTIVFIPVVDFKFDYPYDLGDDEYIASYQKIAQSPNVCKITVDKNLLGKWEKKNETPSNECEPVLPTWEFFNDKKLEKINTELSLSEEDEVECVQSIFTENWFNLTSNDDLDQLVTFYQEDEIIYSNQVWDYKISGNELTLKDFSSDKVDVLTKIE